MAEEEKKNWKEIMKERRRKLYQEAKARRKEYMNRPEVKERMQIAKAKAKNQRKKYLKELKERMKRKKKANI